jgi:hypothetical protein
MIINYLIELCREIGRYPTANTISAYNNLYGLNGSVRQVPIFLE